MQINSGGLTDVGRIREDNEDDFLIVEDQQLFALADGVGGAAAGEIASHIFVKACEAEFSRQQTWDIDCRQLIHDSFDNANDHISKFAQNSPNSAGMGCTGIILTFCNGNFFVGHVGDSRCYLLRAGQLIQITKDHSVNQEKIDLGLATEAEVANSPNNAIYLAVGHMKGQKADIYKNQYQAGDLFLMCSDGLSDMVSSEDIRSILVNRNSDLEKTAKMLVDAANMAGGNDNVTALLVSIGE